MILIAQEFKVLAAAILFCVVTCIASNNADAGVAVVGSGTGGTSVQTTYMYGCYQTTQMYGHTWNHIDTSQEQYCILNNLICRNNYYLIDRTRFNITTDKYYNVSTMRLDLTMQDGDNIWTETANAAGIDAHVFGGITYDYIKNVLLRPSPSINFNGTDGAMKTLVDATTTDCTNAGFTNGGGGWTGSEILFCNGPPASPNYNCDPASTFLPASGASDIVAHEWGHALTFHSHARGDEINLGTTPMDEAFSDWLGIAVKHAYKTSYNLGWTDSIYDWRFGADIATQHVAIRDLKDPTYPYTFYGASPDYFYGDTPTSPNWCYPSDTTDCIHKNAGVANKMFYLLSAGGQHPVSHVYVNGIGIDNAMKIAYNANNLYWQQVPLSFADADAGMVKAAQDVDRHNLYSTNYTQQVTLAWHAVGIGSPVSVTTYSYFGGGGTVRITSQNIPNPMSPPVYAAGDVVTLTAIPNSNSGFLDWSGACSGSNPICTIVVDGTTGINATAIFL